MERLRRLAPGKHLLAAGLLALGVVGLAFGDYPPEWQPLPGWFPARHALTQACAVLMIACAAGLLARPTLRLSARVLAAYTFALWLLKWPPVLRAPGVEVNWLSLGESAMLAAAGAVLLLEHGGTTLGPRALRAVRRVYGASLVPIGLSHFVYLKLTVSLVPAWLPAREGLALLTGAGHIAAGLGLLFGVVPWLAAAMEAGMVFLITALVWLPRFASAPTDRVQWTEAVLSWTLGAAAWLVAESLRTQPRRGPESAS